MAGNLRARAVAWWRRSHADLEKRDFRRVGLIAFGVVGASVVLARLTQDTPAAGAIRALAITLFVLAAIALFVVVILMGEEVVHEMDASDPMRARHGGAYGPRIKRFVREAPRASRAWIASIPGKVRGLRHDLTRESLSRMAKASVAALGGVPPADAGPPPGAGRLARPTGDAHHAASDEPAGPTRRVPTPPQRRRALTASELTDQPRTTTRRRANPRSARRAGPPRRSRSAGIRAGGSGDTDLRSRD